MKPILTLSCARVGAASPAARTEAFTATLAAFLEDFDLADFRQSVNITDQQG